MFFTPIRKSEAEHSNAQVPKEPFSKPRLTINAPGDQVMRIQEGDAPIVQRIPSTPVAEVQNKQTEKLIQRQNGTTKARVIKIRVSGINRRICFFFMPGTFSLGSLIIDNLNPDGFLLEQWSIRQINQTVGPNLIYDYSDAAFLYRTLTGQYFPINSPNKTPADIHNLSMTSPLPGTVTIAQFQDSNDLSSPYFNWYRSYCRQIIGARTSGTLLGALSARINRDTRLSAGDRADLRFVINVITSGSTVPTISPRGIATTSIPNFLTALKNGVLMFNQIGL